MSNATAATAKDDAQQITKLINALRVFTAADRSSAGQTRY